MHGLEAEYWGRIDFVYLNREDPANIEIVDRFGVIYQPVFVLTDPDGAEVLRWYYFDPALLRAEFDSYLGSED